MKSIFLLSFIALIGVSCQKKDNKKLITEEKTVKIGAFEKLVNHSTVNIEITDDVPKDEIHLKGTKESIESFENEIVSGVLTFKNNKTFQFSEQDPPLTAQINHSMLEEIEIAGVGSLKGKLPQTNNEIQITVSGAGDVQLEVMNEKTSVLISGVGNVNLKGKTIQLLSKITGAGNLDALELESETSQNSISGIGNASVWSTQSINCSITGVGNLNYKMDKNVKIESKIEGLGRVKQTK